MIKFEMKIEGQKSFKRGWDRLEMSFRRIGSTGVWNVIKRWFYEHIDQTFASEGSNVGPRWAELDPVYEKWKKVRYPGMPILQASGALRKALTGSDSHGGYTIEKDDSLEIGIAGTNVAKYWRTHQHGRGPIKQRMNVKVTDRSLRDLDGEMQKHIKKTVRDAFGGVY